MILSSVLQAVGLFVATNIDDIIVVSLFFARGRGQRGTTVRITAGQYLGFAGILAVAVFIALGAGAFLPVAAIPYFGLIPLALGLHAAWASWRGVGDDDDDDGKGTGNKVGILGVAGGDIRQRRRQHWRLRSRVRQHQPRGTDRLLRGISCPRRGPSLRRKVRRYPPPDRRRTRALGKRAVSTGADLPRSRHFGLGRSVRFVTACRGQTRGLSQRTTLDEPGVAGLSKCDGTRRSGMAPININASPFRP